MGIQNDMTEQEIRQEVTAAIMEYASEPTIEGRIRKMAFDIVKWKRKLLETRHQLSKAIEILNNMGVHDSGVRLP